MAKWYIDGGNNSDVVMSSKIRLARNLADAPFPARMNSEIRKSTNKKIFAAIKNSSLASEFEMEDIASMSKAESYSLAEKRLISKEFAANNNSSLLLSKDESVSIMLCEEDHIRLYAMSAGQNLEKAYEIANRVDNILIKNLKIAFSDNLGFLTSSPTNLGTGMKASVMLHLPALKAQNQIERLGAMIAKLGLSLRQMFGENGEKSAFYALSNHISLGISEQSAIDNLNAVTNQIIKQERAAREILKDSEEFEDIVFRAMGTLKMARRLSCREFFELASVARLGASLGYFDNSTYEKINKLISEVQDATLIKNADAPLSREMCDKLRAQLVREELNK